MVIVDTDLLVGFLRGNSDAIAKVQSLERQQEPLLTTTFSVFELCKGAYASNHKERDFSRLHALLRDLKIVSFGQSAASIAAENHVFLSHKGRPVGTIDNFIAAICIAERQRIVTRNIKDFKGIPDIRVESW